MNWKVVLVLLLVVSLGVLGTGAFAQGEGGLSNPAAGHTGFEFVGQIDQNNFDLVIYGYITYLDGVAIDRIFVEGTDPIFRSEKEAFFTFQATGSIYSRSVLQPIFNTNANLTMTVYYNSSPSATFEDPASFTTGIPVAVYTVRLQNVLNVQAPDVAIASSTGELTQTEATPFTFLGQERQFGQVDSTLRLTAFGQGFRQSTEPLVVRLIVAGNTMKASD